MFLYIYIGCLTFGLFYSLFAIFFGDHGAIDSHDIDHGGTDGVSPLKPIVIATFITLFGGFGLIGNSVGSLASIFVLLLAILAGLIGAALIFYTVVVPMYKCQSNSLASTEKMKNLSGSVITPIPENGLGEISYTIGETRYTSPARSLEGGEIEKGSDIVIVETKDSVATVIKRPEVRL